VHLNLSNLTLDTTDLIFKKSQAAVESALKKFAPLNDALLTQLSQGSALQAKLDKVKLKYSTIAVVGIGGSSLGVQVLAEYFAKDNFIFFDNVDAFHFEHQMATVKDLKKTLWLFISKSGETIESLVALELIHQFYAENSLSLSEQTIVITENKSNSLYNWAVKNKVTTFEVPLSVGGRYSILSHVGLVPAVLMNLDISAFEKGARSAISSQKQLVEFVGEVALSYQRKESITILWSYSSRLKKFGFWWQQLWAESLGKKSNIHGGPAPAASTPLPLIGATDQHSVLQQVAEGVRDKYVVFLRSGASESGELKIKHPIFESTNLLKSQTMGALLSAEAEATRISLDSVNVSNMTMKVDHHNEETLGYLFMFFQISVLALGQFLEINPVDQPGVEHGKKLCKQILAERI
jgi:glucose-6-phosphate isomerase